MSGYTRTRRRQLTQTETLFDDETFKTIVESDPMATKPGVSVELGARALALKLIMDTHNYSSRVAGAERVHQHEDNEFDARYARPDIVRKNMERKESRMIQANQKDFRTLNATDGLIAAGYGVERAETQQYFMTEALLEKYGPGNANARDRERVVRMARAAAEAGNSTLRKT